MGISFMLMVKDYRRPPEGRPGPNLKPGLNREGDGTVFP